MVLFGRSIGKLIDDMIAINVINFKVGLFDSPSRCHPGSG